MARYWFNNEPQNQVNRNIHMWFLYVPSIQFQLLDSWLCSFSQTSKGQLAQFYFQIQKGFASQVSQNVNSTPTQATSLQVNQGKTPRFKFLYNPIKLHNVVEIVLPSTIRELVQRLSSFKLNFPKPSQLFLLSKELPEV